MEDAPRPPPKRKDHKLVASYGAGSGHNVARALQDSNYSPNSNTYDDGGLESPTNRSVRKEKQQKSFKKKASRVCVIDGTPDAVIGEDVEMNGEFQFDRFLRIDGKFQGTLFSESKGDLIVGRKGCIIGDVIIARKMIVEGGHIAGKLVVDELLLLDHSVIKGDITCKAIEITGSSVTIAGRANVHPLAPELIDEHGNIISEIPKKVKKPKVDIYTNSPSSSGNPRSPKKDQGIQSAPEQSVQTNASAKPSRSRRLNNNLVDEEEAASVEQAMLEHNIIKDRRKQMKQSKSAAEIPNSSNTVKDPKFLPVSRTKTSPPGQSPQKQPQAPTQQQQQQPQASSSSSANLKQMLPPSPEQRSIQAEQDANGQPQPPTSSPSQKPGADVLPSVDGSKAAEVVPLPATATATAAGESGNQPAEPPIAIAAAESEAAAAPSPPNASAIRTLTGQDESFSAMQAANDSNLQEEEEIKADEGSAAAAAVQAAKDAVAADDAAKSISEKPSQAAAVGEGKEEESAGKEEAAGGAGKTTGSAGKAGAGLDGDDTLTNAAVNLQRVARGNSSRKTTNEKKHTKGMSRHLTQQNQVFQKALSDYTNEEQQAAKDIQRTERGRQSRKKMSRLGAAIHGGHSQSNLFELRERERQGREKTCTVQYSPS